MLLRVGDVEASQRDCAAFASSTTSTFTIDGQPVPVTAIPCRYVARPVANMPDAIVGNWFTEFRTLIAPGTLAAGSHLLADTITVNSTYTYTLSCTDPSGICTVPAGTVETFTGHYLTISNG